MKRLRRPAGLQTRRGKIITSIISLILLIVIAIVVVVKILSSPAVGTVSAPPPPTSSKKTANNSPGIYNGKLVSFTYPAHYEKISVGKSPGYLEVANFFATDHTSKKIAVAIRNQNLEDDPSVNYRRQHKELYREVSHTSSSLVFASTTSASEYTTFMSHGSQEISISFSSPYPANFSADMATLVSSLKWK